MGDIFQQGHLVDWRAVVFVQWTCFWCWRATLENKYKVLFSYALNCRPSDEQMSLPILIATDENDSRLLKSRHPSKTLTLDQRG